MKYIDADKLIAEIERRIEETKSMKPSFDQFWAGQISAFKGAIKIAESLQQEQQEKGLDVTEFCKPINSGIAKCVADHWWEFLDDKDTEEKQPEVDLAEEITRFFSKNPIPHEHITDWPLLKNTAIHFYELGLNAGKED